MNCRCQQERKIVYMFNFKGEEMYEKKYYYALSIKMEYVKLF